MKIGIFSISGIGDSIMDTPLIKKIRIQHSHAIINVITTKTNEPLFRYNKNINNIIIYTWFYKNPFQWLINILFMSLLTYDRIYFCVASSNKETGIIAKLSRAFTYGFVNRTTKFRPYTISVKFEKNTHDLILNQKMMSGKNVLKLESIVHNIKQKLHSKKPVLGLHIRNFNNNSIQKILLNILFFDIIKLLHKKYNIILFCGPKDNVDGLEKIFKKRIHVSKNLSLLKTCKLISSCNYFISTDSGLAHIASTYNIPSLVIFGPTNEHWTRPFSINTEIITSKVDCRPCYKFMGQKISCNNSQKYKCVRDITAEYVIKRFRRMIKNEKEKHKC